MKPLRTRVDIRVVATVAAVLLVLAAPAGAQPGGGGGGKAKTAKLQLTPTKQSFGSVAVGLTGSAVSFTVSNVGTATTGPISFVLTGTNAAEFNAAPGATNGCVSGTTALAAGASCKIDVRLAPTSVGKKTAGLTVADGRGAGSPSATLSGTATAPASLTIDPTVHDFGSIVGGHGSFPFTFTVRNAGTATSSAISFSLTGANVGEFATLSLSGPACVSGTTTLAGGASCTIDVVFFPADLGPGGAYGARSAELQVLSSNPYETGTSAGLLGVSVEPDYVSISPTDHDFGQVAPGNTNTTTFTVTNTGTHTTAAVHAAVTGTDATEFSVPNLTDFCNGVFLTVGDTCTFDVEFDPSSADPRSAEARAWTANTHADAIATISGNNGTGCSVTANSGCIVFDNAVTTSGTKTYTLNGTVVFSPTCQYGAAGCDYSDYTHWYSASGTFSVDDGATNIDSGTWTARFYDAFTAPEYDDAALNLTTCAAADIRLFRFVIDFHGGTGDWPTSFAAVRQDASDANPPKSYVELMQNFGPAGGDFQGPITGVTISC